MKTLAEIEQEYILAALSEHKNNIEQTAKALDITPRTIRNKLKQYGIDSRSLAREKPSTRPIRYQKRPQATKVYTKVKCAHCKIMFKMDAYYHATRVNKGQVNFFCKGEHRGLFNFYAKKKKDASKYVELNCAYCKKKFQKLADDYIYKTKQGQIEFSCNLRCANRLKMKDRIEKKKAETMVSIPCAYCNKYFQIEKWYYTHRIKNAQQDFFCRSAHKAAYVFELRNKEKQAREAYLFRCIICKETKTSNKKETQICSEECYGKQKQQIRMKQLGLA